jgi:hypothetical protein
MDHCCISLLAQMCVERIAKVAAHLGETVEDFFGIRARRREPNG